MVLWDGGWKDGGEGGIRTLEARFSELAPLAGVCLQPLGHFSARRAKSSVRIGIV